MISMPAPRSLINASLPAKKPRRSLLVCVTATSAARNSALRELVPPTVSLNTGSPAEPRVMSTRTCAGPTNVKLRLYAASAAASR